MSKSEWRLFFAGPPPEAAPDGLKTRRESLGLSESDGGQALMLSVAQVRGIETGSIRPFYNEGFYERAKARYVALLNARRALERPAPEPAVEYAAQTERLTLGGSEEQ
jgi:transcriptional regulator with XRE-family HTH domain